MSDTPTPKRKVDPTAVAIGAAAILLLWFAIQNGSSVTVHFWLTTVHAPLILVIACAAILGALIVALWNRIQSKSKRQKGR